MPSIHWLDWNDVTFEAAKRDDKPVLLFIKASWCRWCKSMEQDTYSDPDVVQIVEKEFIPIRVDHERRPEINTRYNMGGWPTTAFLTPGGEAITGGTFFDPKTMKALLEKISIAYKEDRDGIEQTIMEMISREDEEKAERTGDADLSLDIITNISRSIISEFDEKYGGFGTGQKFPHSEAIDFATLQYFKTNDIKLLGVINKTLSGMAEGRLFDKVGGGFFRFCAARDWGAPHTEKLLETNAKLLGNYLDAFRVMDSMFFWEIAQKTVSYICANLWDEKREAFCGSQDEDDDYYQLEKVERQDRKPPHKDHTIHSNLNALTACAFLKAGAVLDNHALQSMGVSAIEFILRHMYSPERGVYHYFDTNRHILGLLSDQIYLCQALLQAVEYTGENRYLDIIRDLIETIVRKHESDQGGFYDIPQRRGATGSLTRRNKSILENAVMARVLIRYHYITFEDRYLKLARKTLRAFARDYHMFGHFTAGYGCAVDLFYYKPIYVIIIGKQESPKTTMLRKAATRIYLPSRIVQTLDPETEPSLVEKMRFPIGSEPKAYVCLEQSCHAAVEEPDRLKDVMLDLETNRAPKR